MTNIPPNPPPEPSEGSTPVLQKFYNFIKKPSSLIAGGVLLSLGVATYGGVSYFVYEKLSPLLSQQLSKALEREVRVGEVESFSFNHIRIGQTSIPTTENDPDRVDLDGLTVQFNPLPLLIGQPLDIDITIDDPNLYVEQNPSGKWLGFQEREQLEETELNLPVDIDADIELNNANIALLPNGFKELIKIDANGTGGYTYRSNEEQEVSYDLDVSLLNSEIAIKGQTNIKSFQTQTSLMISQLALPELAAIIPNLPVTLKSGLVDSNLNINVPSLEEIEGTAGNGNFELSNVQAGLEALKVPIQLDLGLNFNNQTVQFNETRIKLGEFATDIKGSLDWQKGYDIDVDINPFLLKNISNILKIQLPVNLAGEVEGKIKLTGAIKNPIVTGTINNSKPLLIEKTRIEDLKTVFQANLNQINLKEFQVKPTAGGNITATGKVELGILKALEENKEINWQKMPIALKFEAKVPGDELAQPYYQSPQNVSIGTLEAQGQIGGTLGDPKGKIEWSAPGVIRVSGENISGRGSILLGGKDILIRDTVLTSDEGNLTVRGLGNLEEKEWQTQITANQFSLDPFVELACSFITCPPEVLTQAVTLSDGNINIAGKLDDFSLNSLQSQGNLQLQVGQGAIALETALSQGNITATAAVSNLPVDPYIPNLAAPVQLNRSNFNLSGSLTNLFDGGQLNINRLNVNGNAQLLVNGNPLNANIDVGNGILTTTAQVGTIDLNPIIPNLPVQSTLVSSDVFLTGNLNSLLSSLGNTPDISSFRGNAQVQLTVEGSPVQVVGNLGSGQVRGVVDLSSLALDRIVPNLPVNVQLVDGQAVVSSNVLPLLSPQPDLSTAQARVNLQLATANGTVNTLTRLQNNQWTSQITASNLNPNLILSQIAPQVPQTDIDDLNAEISLSGSLASLFEENAILPINANNISVEADGQSLNARGNIVVSNPLTNPDARVNLSVEATSTLDDLPLTQVISALPVRRDFLPEELNLQGVGNFNGTLIGQNLLTAPTAPGNITLTGDVTVRNLVFNDRAFEPLLTGQLNAGLGQTIAINLRGNQDVIAATLQPCNRQDCPAPYLPVAFELRQQAGDQAPIAVIGRLEGDELVARIEQFPLDLFKIAPGGDFGIPGFLSGEVQTEIVINPYTLEGRGRLVIDKPSIGFVEATRLTADVIYQDNIARLQNATLQLGQSLYAVQGSLNLESGDLAGQLNIDEGRLQDLLIALKLSNVERLLDLLQIQPIDYQNAEAIPPQSVGQAAETIAEKVNLLAVIEQRIKELADEREKGGIPTELDFRGTFDLNVALGGTIYRPDLSIALSGQNWEWHPQEPYPDIVEPLGLVIRDESVIPINEVALQADLTDNVLTIDRAAIQIDRTLLALDGKFSLQEIAANWQVNYLSIGTINNFIEVPVDATGALNASGTLSGTPFQPQLQGQFAFVDTTFQGRPLDVTLAGQFSYEGQRFQLATTEDSIASASVDIPFPTYPDNDNFAINVNLGTNALQLVSVLTGEQVFLTGGEGEINAQATGELDVSQGLLVSNLNAGGTITLNETIFQTPALPQPLTVSGVVAINDQGIDVQGIEGNFADSTLNIAGVLPLFQRQSNLENPLTVAIERGQINLDGLYRGLVDGTVIVRGSAIQPVVSGDVQLANGQIFIPTALQSREETVAEINRWVIPRTRRQTASNQPVPFMPKLQNFQVSLDSLFVEVLPLFRFDFGGNIAVDGPINDITALEPDGVITVNRGLVNFLDTRFFIERRTENQIVFSPDQGLLNPTLDLAMRTIVSEVPDTSKNFRSGETTEIPDDSLNKVQRVDISLGLNGPLSQLLPNLGQEGYQVCQIQDPLKPIQTKTALSQEDLNKVSTCLQTLANQGSVDEQLLGNPVINLSSSPPRSQGEIVRLLGEQVLVLAEALQGKSTEQLIQFGIVQLALPMVFQTLIYDIETSISETIDSTDFRVVPFLEAIYEVEDEGYVRVSYDYAFNEFRVRYEKRF
ncbi:translocation/assembly module TamB domain-containing protein [Cyanothece sp. BG0011]|uniref:translocation/assembly module TamB domain-containing protein n=1 Tax=Cyanothece sp. BG0011 TaxID=2082950 RepID=UPI000D1E7A45|nr:translocation/assembly module TamB domain-containing protein [Cyanothece sp. BG0011]